MSAQLQRPHQPSSGFSSSARGPTNSRHASSKLTDDPTLASGAIHVTNNSISSQYSNPFRTPKHTPQASASSNISAFSPVSPIAEESGRYSSRPLAAPQIRKMSQEPRKSVDLRTIDGKPYPGREADADKKARKVKVAQDMYAGELPPGYEKQDFKGPVQSEKALGEKGHRHTDSCGKCGGHKKPQPAGPVSSEMPSSTPSQPQNIDCNKCGGKRSMPPSSFPGAASNARVMPPIQSSEAGPSNAPNAHKHKCTKCGRRKRPESMSTSASSSQSQSPQQTTYHRSIPSIQTNGIPVNINIEPPTAITERAPTLPFSPASTLGETPLIRTQQHNQSPDVGRKPSRTGSISRLFRSLSGRKKSMDQSPPSQPMPTDPQQNSSRKSTSYSKLRPDEHIERPASPFSFVDKPQEEQAFEMNDIRQSKLPARRDSWDKADESTMFLGRAQSQRPRLSRSQSTTAAKFPSGSAQPVDDVYLALPPDQRPGITRFKSLRTGVNRAANGLSRSASQISRSSSLRRLESVKKVPSLWYRDDMAIEGASSEYDHYGY